MTLKEAVLAAGISDAHIVDDAYDQVPGAGLGDGPINTFLSSLGDQQFSELCTLLGLAEDEAVITEHLRTADGAAKLYAHRSAFGAVGDTLFEDFVQATEPEKNRLRPLITFLSELGVNCHTFGRNYDIDAEPAPQLLFVDLKLNERDIILDEPIRVVQKMKMKYPHASPMVLLMSAQTQALKAHRTIFRDRCELFSSQFEDLSKRTVASPQSLQRYVAHHIEAYPRVLQLRRHVEAWSRAMRGAQSKLESTLRRLDLPDYFVLHNTAKAEDVEFGGYVVDLLLGHIGNEVETSQDVGQFAAELNKWELKELTRSRFNVEPLVGDIFSANVVHPHARLEAERERGFSPSDGYLNLGDIFFQRSEINENAIKMALVILTAACDLVRPTLIAERKASIFLCEGVVKALAPSTDLVGEEGLDPVILRFPHEDGRQYVIDWRKKRPHTWDYKQLERMRNPETFEWVHVGRLRQLYALQLQRTVFADIGRVGTLRRPAPYLPHGVEVLVPRAGKWTLLLNYGNDPTAGAISDDKGAQRKTFILSDVLVREVFERVFDWLAANDEEHAASILRELYGCDEAVDSLMFHVASTKDKRALVYPLEQAALPAELKARLEKSVLFAVQRSEDDGVCAGKPFDQHSPAVLAFRFVKI
jgi:hypothetical protein